MIHELKIEPKYYEAIRTGEKTFEVRENDRDYRAGDYLALNELNDSRDGYTGRSMLVKVTSILNDERFCKENFVIMGITKCIICNDGEHYTEIKGVMRSI